MKANFQNITSQFTVKLITLLTVVAACAHAATITVTNAADSGPGTLREAVASAANGDTINFALTPPAKITLTTGELLVAKNVSILGPGASSLAVDGNRSNRVFHIGWRSNTVIIAGLTITNGMATGVPTESNWGGGIFNDHSSLTVSNCVVSGNAAFEGGGIFNMGGWTDASLTIVASTLAGNSAYVGGGIVNFCLSFEGSGNAYLQIAKSTLSHNSATYGGGVWTGNGNASNNIVRVLNSTFSGNYTDFPEYDRGGDFFIGGGGWNTALEIGSTILTATAGVSGGSIVHPGSSSVVTSLGYNLSNDDGGGVLTNATDLINTPAWLGPLQDNGGPTPTHAFTCRSPAIDHGKNFSGSTTDQRGSARAFDDPAAANVAGGDGTDIGAFEAQQPLPVCNFPPVADASATTSLVISPNGNNATVILDGSRSSDPDGDVLQYGWREAGNALASGVVAVTVLPVGAHTIQLVVSDATLSATNETLIEVITAGEAVSRLAASLGANVPRPQPLLAALNAAIASADRSNPTAAINQLLAFQNKVRAQVEPIDPALAASLILSAQEVIDALSGAGGTNPGGRPHGRFTSLTRGPNGRVRMQFSAARAGSHLIEASSDLVNWELVGVATQRDDGQFEYEDSQSARHTQRYYRIRSE